jgi:hypothetical protein
MRSAPAALLAVALAAGCASGGPLPGDVPADLDLSVTCEGGLNPHCDFSLRLRADGTLEYAVEHRGTTPGDRRGTARLEPAAVRAVWRAVQESGVFGLPALLPPGPGGEERGRVTFEVRSAGREARVVADRAGQPGLDGILRELFRATPWSIWQPPRAER